MRLIDADALKAKFISWLPTDPQEGGTEVENIAVSSIMEIEESPTMDAVPVVRGEWKQAARNVDGICSWCNTLGDNRWLYCPNCGAKMEGTE